MIAPGATVSEGQAVMELETDKAVVEVPSSVSGKVQEIRVKEGDKIKVGQVIFTVENHAGAAAAAAPKSATVPPAQRASGERISGESAAATNSQPAPASPSAASTSPAAPSPAAPSPAAPTERRAAAQRTRSTDAAAATEFRLQELGENISEGDLVRLMIAPGAKVSEGQPVMELETDKAVVEVPSSVLGVGGLGGLRHRYRVAIVLQDFGDGFPAGAICERAMHQNYVLDAGLRCG